MGLEDMFGNPASNTFVEMFNAPVVGATERENTAMADPTTVNPGPSPFARPASLGAASPTLPGASPLPPGAGGAGDGLIQLNQTLEGVDASGGGPKLELGFWPAKVTKIEPGTASTGNQSLTFHLMFIQWPGQPVNPNAGKTGKHTVYVTPPAMWKVKQSALAIGQGDALTSLNGKAAENVLVMVDVLENKYKNKQGNEVVGTRCESIYPWPVEGGGPGTKFNG